MFSEHQQLLEQAVKAIHDEATGVRFRRVPVRRRMGKRRLMTARQPSKLV